MRFEFRWNEPVAYDIDKYHDANQANELEYNMLSRVSLYALCASTTALPEDRERTNSLAVLRQKRI